MSCLKQLLVYGLYGFVQRSICAKLESRVQGTAIVCCSKGNDEIDCNTSSSKAHGSRGEFSFSGPQSILNWGPFWKVRDD